MTPPTRRPREPPGQHAAASLPHPPTSLWAPISPQEVAPEEWAARLQTGQKRRGAQRSRKRQSRGGAPSSGPAEAVPRRAKKEHAVRPERRPAAADDPEPRPFGPAHAHPSPAASCEATSWSRIAKMRTTCTPAPRAGLATSSSLGAAPRDQEPLQPSCPRGAPLASPWCQGFCPSFSLQRLGSF